jgi:AbrB family looped-hinge helix DNA binding protein
MMGKENRGATMPTATVSTKGQITLPVASRRALGIKPHDRVTIEVRQAEIVVKPVPDFFELDGFLGKGATAEEEREAILEAACDRAMGKR